MVGGTWRSLACFAMADVGHPLADPHGFTLDANQAARLAKRVRLTKPSKLAAPRVGEMRAAMLPHAAALLQVLLARLRPTRLVFSSWGLREGRLFDRLDSVAKAQDPLLAGVGHFAAPRGGPPALAARIAAWSAAASRANGSASERLRLAATMLALASMQIEPNLRLRHAINWALYKRWIDLTDEGRAMIAAAVSANCGSLGLPKPLGRLAGQDALDEAVRWGLAIRLARRLGAGSCNSLMNSALVAHERQLMLYLGESHADLWAGHVESDLAALAKRLGLTPAMEVVPNDRLPFTADRTAIPIEV
jgi:exopolyphosphatase/guanosine-5'-triphosphate,3'-diphosphate pyrophosphatase